MFRHLNITNKNINGKYSKSNRTSTFSSTGIHNFLYFYIKQFKSLIIESNEPNNNPYQNNHNVNTSLDLNTSAIASNGNDKTNASINDLLEDSLNNACDIIPNIKNNNEDVIDEKSLNESDVLKLSEYVQKEKNCLPLLEKQKNQKQGKNIAELLSYFDDFSKNIYTYFAKPKAKGFKKKKITKNGDII